MIIFWAFSSGYEELFCITLSRLEAKSYFLERFSAWRQEVDLFCTVFFPPGSECPFLYCAVPPGGMRFCLICIVFIMPSGDNSKVYRGLSVR